MRLTLSVTLYKPDYITSTTLAGSRATGKQPANPECHQPTASHRILALSLPSSETNTHSQVNIAHAQAATFFKVRLPLF